MYPNFCLTDPAKRATPNRYNGSKNRPGCRCGNCRAAVAEKMRAVRQRRKAGNPTLTAVQTLQRLRPWRLVDCIDLILSQGLKLKDDPLAPEEVLMEDQSLDEPLGAEVWLRFSAPELLIEPAARRYGRASTGIAS